MTISGPPPTSLGPEAQRGSTLVGRQMTPDEFIELPVGKPHLELIAGVVRQKVSPKFRHGLAQLRLAKRIDDFGQQHGLGVAVTETRFIEADWAPVPDISFYRWEHLPPLSGEPDLDEIRIPPDLAVEILSPGQPIGELIDKCIWFAEHGVRVTLLVHPRERSVRVFRPGRRVQVQSGADRIDLDDVLPGFELTVEQLFDFLVLRPPTRGQAPAE